jgi:hypothetical protein
VTSATSLWQRTDGLDLTYRGRRDYTTALNIRDARRACSATLLGRAGWITRIQVACRFARIALEDWLLDGEGQRRLLGRGLVDVEYDAIRYH